VTFLAQPRLKGVLFLEGIVDIKKEKQRLDGDIKGLQGQVRQKEGLLKNQGFVKRAPKEVVDKERARLEELKLKIKNLTEVRDGLK
jgi:valyl-tRNA synthetase